MNRRGDLRRVAIPWRAAKDPRSHVVVKDRPYDWRREEPHTVTPPR